MNPINTYIDHLRRRHMETVPLGSVQRDEDGDPIEYQIPSGQPNPEEQLMREERNAALRRVVAFGFEEMRLNRIEAQHEVDNPASGRVMLHAGMRYEGTLRQRLKNKGKYVDVALYAILKNDPRP